MPKTCAAPGCCRPVFAKLYCEYHQYLRTDKKPKPIQAYSKKRVKVNRVYNEAARQYREANPWCAIRSPVCTGKTQGVHHVKGRGLLLNDKAHWLPACNPCNSYVEANTEWAVQHGFKESKFINN